jgi:hypothetical protein
MATCEKCGNEPGNQYTFLYGHESATAQVSGTTTTTTRRFNVSGEETVSIGDGCIQDYRDAKKHFWNISLAVFLPVAAVSLIVGIPASGDSPLKLLVILGMIAGSLGGIGLIFRHSHATRSRDQVGEDLGIEVRRSALEAKGVNGFWTHVQWKNMQKTFK